MHKSTVLPLTLAAFVTVAEVAPCRSETHVHSEMRGDVSIDTLPPSAAIFRQDVMVNLTGLALKATAGSVQVRTT